jgi:PhzF family phenazine biosynthesis protein
MRLRLYQVDAFTSRRFHGNPAAVVLLEAWLPDDVLRDVAAENNLAETAFLVPGRDVDFDLRWFTPTVEIDLCGHATLASAHVLWQHEGFAGTRLRFGSRSGVLEVTRDGPRHVLDFPARPGTPVDPRGGAFEDLSRALGARPLEVLQARDCMAVLATEDDVRALRPEMARLEALDTFAVIVTAPGRDVDFVSRFFGPRAGVPEDPVTGSAHCTLVPYWAARLGRRDLAARQVSARGGELSCRDVPDAPGGGRVLIAGEAVTYLEGTIRV